MQSQDIKHRPARSWLKISMDVPLQLSESVAGYLSGLTDSGLEYITHPDGEHETIIVYLEDHQPGPAIENQLRSFISKLSGKPKENNAEVKLRTELILEEDWNKNWKKHFTPIHITDHIVIKPSWESYTAQQNEIVIEIDPGMAFGTGHHESTSLAARLIEDSFLEGITPENVLDFGTGTGILAMACALLGAKHVLANDNDSDAVQAAKDNVHRNGLNKIIRVNNIPVANITDSFDLLVANITHDVLTDYAEKIYSLLKPSGNLIMAGILKGEQEESIRSTFTQLGLTELKSLSKGEWAAFYFTRS